MKKRLFAVLTALCLILVLLPITASAIGVYDRDIVDDSTSQEEFTENQGLVHNLKDESDAQIVLDYGVPEDGVTLVFLYSASLDENGKAMAPYCESFIRSLSTWQYANSVHIVGIDFTSYTREQALAFVNTYGMMDTVDELYYGKMPNTGISGPNNWFKRLTGIGSSTASTYGFLVTRNEDGQKVIRYDFTLAQSATELDTYVKSLLGGEETVDTSTPAGQAVPLNKVDSSATDIVYLKDENAVYDYFDKSDTPQTKTLDYDVPDDGVTVLLFFRGAMKNDSAVCTRSSSLVEQLATAEWAKNENVNIVCVESSTASKENLGKFMTTYCSKGISEGIFDHIYYNPTSNNTFNWYQALTGINGSFCTAYVIEKDGNEDKIIRYGFSSLSSAKALGECVESVLSGEESYSGTKTIRVYGTENYTYAKQVAEQTGRYRVSQGLGALNYNETLTKLAMQRAAEIAVRFSHTRPNDMVYDTVNGIEIDGEVIYSADLYSEGSENIAAGQTTPEQVLQSWQESTGHNENMLKEQWTQIGVGVFESNGRIYWVQLFSVGDTTATYTKTGTDTKAVDVDILASDASVYADPTTVTLEQGKSGTICLYTKNEDDDLHQAILRSELPKSSLGTFTYAADGSLLFTAENVGSETIRIDSYDFITDGAYVTITVTASSGSGTGSSSETVTDPSPNAPLKYEGTITSDAGKVTSVSESESGKILSTTARLSYTVPENGVTMLLFFRGDGKSTATNSLLSGLGGLSWPDNEKVNIVAVESTLYEGNAATKYTALCSYLAEYSAASSFDSVYLSSKDYVGTTAKWFKGYIDSNGTDKTVLADSIDYPYIVLINEIEGTKYIRYAFSGDIDVDDLTESVNYMLSDGSLDDYALTVSTNTDTGTTVLLKNNTDSTADIWYLIAAYNGDGMMISVNGTKETLPIDGSTSLSISYSKSEQVKTIKAFVWDSTTIVPLREAWVMQKY